MRQTLALFFVFLLTACAVEKAITPPHPAEVAALAFVQASYNGKTPQVLALMAGIDHLKTEEQKLVLGKIEAKVQAAAQRAKEKGGVESVAVNPQIPSNINADAARVFVRVTFGDGTAADEMATLATENGVWKVIVL